MHFRICLIFYVIFSCIVDYSSGVLSEGALSQTKKLIKSICNSRAKVKEDVLAAVKVGNISDSRDLSCYMNCALNMMKVMRNGKVNIDSARRQLELLMPDSYKIPMEQQLEICHTVEAGIDPCDIAAAFVKCAHGVNPSSPVIPL